MQHVPKRLETSLEPEESNYLLLEADSAAQLHSMFSLTKSSPKLKTLDVSVPKLCSIGPLSWLSWQAHIYISCASATSARS